MADRVQETQEPAAEVWDHGKRAGLLQRLSKLEATCQSALEEQGFEPTGINVERFLNMRYTGTDTSIMTLQPEDSEDFGAAFEAEYMEEFGFKLDVSRLVILVTLHAPVATDFFWSPILRRPPSSSTMSVV